MSTHINTKLLTIVINYPTNKKQFCKKLAFFQIYMVQSCWSMGPPPPREGGRVTTPRPPLWYCGTSRVSWQSSRQQNMFQINNKYTTPAPPLWYCGTSRVSWQASRQQNMFQINNKLWYCGTSRVSWQASRQQNMFQINNKYTTPAPPVVLWYF